MSTHSVSIKIHWNSRSLLSLVPFSYSTVVSVLKRPGFASKELAVLIILNSAIFFSDLDLALLNTLEIYVSHLIALYWTWTRMQALGWSQLIYLYYLYQSCNWGHYNMPMCLWVCFWSEKSYLLLSAIVNNDEWTTRILWQASKSGAFAPSGFLAFVLYRHGD
jgi:hypothetical protein